METHSATTRTVFPCDLYHRPPDPCPVSDRTGAPSPLRQNWALDRTGPPISPEREKDLVPSQTERGPTPWLFYTIPGPKGLTISSPECLATPGPAYGPIPGSGSATRTITPRYPPPTTVPLAKPAVPSQHRNSASSSQQVRELLLQLATIFLSHILREGLPQA